VKSRSSLTMALSLPVPSRRFAREQCAEFTSGMNNTLRLENNAKGVKVTDAKDGGIHRGEVEA